MIVNVIDIKGVWSSGAIDNNSSLNIPALANTTKSILAADAQGFVNNASIADKTRYEFYENSSVTQAYTTTGSQVFIDGQNNKIDGGLHTWNSSSSVFHPEAIGKVYTMRYEGLVIPTGGNPILHVDFDVSGSPTFSEEWGVHHQSEEILIRNAGTHQHVHATFSIITDETLFASGGYIRGETSTGTITIASSSVLIKEG